MRRMDFFLKIIFLNFVVKVLKVFFIVEIDILGSDLVVVKVVWKSFLIWLFIFYIIFGGELCL